MIAMISYRARDSFEQRFGRQRQPGNDDLFAVESYLRYQGEKLVDRFDANCYVQLTLQMDSHDVSLGRGNYETVLRSIEQPALIIGIDSDILYPVAEQAELSELIPGGELSLISSPHGHDAFLIELDQMDRVISTWMKRHHETSRIRVAAESVR
jgi:homoserine O-acetyltransferase